MSTGSGSICIDLMIERLARVRDLCADFEDAVPVDRQGAIGSLLVETIDELAAADRQLQYVDRVLRSKDFIG